MKWIFFSLLALNVALLSIQWVDVRNEEVSEIYIQESSSKNLVLLGEDKKSQNVNGQDAKLCVLVGPVSTRVIAKDLLKSMHSDDADSRLVVQEVAKAPSYWVYFDEFEGSAVEEWLNKFKEKGIDSYLVQSGKLKGMLSLGVFENIDLAQRLKKSMKKRGYQAKISEINKIDNEFWLLLSSTYAAENKKEIDEILMSLKKIPEKREIYCKSVASEK